ncbi:MAG: hypothetical protein ACLPWG_08935 [Steroidobacteraceae bacterium]
MFKSGKPDRCGVTLLAGRAVGAPFVGAVAANLVVTELPRLLHGGTLCKLIELDDGAVVLAQPGTRRKRSGK